jgi:SAM-dependent methyltransferase
MRREFVSALACPISGDALRLDANADDGDGVVQRGELVCEACSARWPVDNGIPRLVPLDLVDQQRATAAAFGWQWQHFSELHPEFEAQFLDWLDPLDRDFFSGKRILDAGCGTGRHAYLAALYGAREVVALDLSSAVEAARINLARFENVHVVQGDLLRPPFPAANGDGFDFVYSIGVLHHLPDPYAGFRSLVRFVRPGGTIAVWVYGYENNGVVRNVVEPLRRLTTRIPTRSLRAVAAPLAVGFHAAAKAIYRPLRGTRVGRALPLNEYLSSVADFSFRQNYGIVFDQLAAPTAAYIKGAEFERWFEESGLVDVRISHRHGNSWRGCGRVPSAA